MNKDYRRSPPAARRRSGRRGSCAFWFLLGGVIGAFGVGYAWMLHDPAAPDATSEEATTRPAAKPAQERQFDFFSMLPEEEVVVPVEEVTEPIALPPVKVETPASQPSSPPPSAEAGSVPAKPATTASAPPAAASATPASGSSYLLQLASFRSAADAERLKAQMALKGIQTSIQTVTIDNGQIYHRVRTASYDKAEAEAMRAKLRSDGQDSIMIRAR